MISNNLVKKLIQEFNPENWFEIMSKNLYMILVKNYIRKCELANLAPNFCPTTCEKNLSKNSL